MREGSPTSHTLRLVNMASIYFVRGGVTRMPPGSGFLKPLDFALHALCIMSLRECSPGNNSYSWCHCSKIKGAPHLVPQPPPQRWEEKSVSQGSSLPHCFHPGNTRDVGGEMHTLSENSGTQCIGKQVANPKRTMASRLFQLPMSISASVFHDMSSLKINPH